MLSRKILLIAALGGIALGLLIAWNAGLFYREDYSTPKGAVKSFYFSVVRGDGTSARQNVVEPAQVPVVDEARNLIVEVRGFRRAAIERFGEEKGDDVSGGLPTLRDIEEANERITGDTAVLATKNGKASLKLRKIGNNWKVDLLSILPFRSDAETARRIFAKSAIAARELAAQIRAGTFLTPEDADQALKGKILTIIVPEMMRPVFGFGKR
ncbi:MAG TPA: hypothetical protein VGP94_09300 [Tepidisphaeraceae bacterium]|jgi:hypothetical protein|nr:hypothetical protein [Tepidisphaeraceae bacterium]